MPCAVLAVNPLASRWKLCNLHRQSHMYVACQSSSLFWFLNERLIVMSVAMSSGIIGVRLPLNNTGIMASKRAESKTMFRAQLGIQSIKCLWTCLYTKTSSCYGQGYQDEMIVASQRETPSVVAEGSVLAYDKWKRKVVDNIEVEQSCKLKKIHLWWKKIWRLRLWGDIAIRGSHEGKERNRKGVTDAEAIFT